MPAAQQTEATDLLANIDWLSAGYAVLIIIAGYVVASFVSRTLFRLASKRVNQQQSLLLKRIAFYIIFILFAVTAMQEMGFNLGVLLGASGILTLAVGFAAQTSISNVISGLFLMVEKSFVVGDTIEVANIKGKVKSIDLLSTKLCTADNRFVRIPSETLIKANLINLTHYPKRRIDIHIGVAYKENIDKVSDVLFDVAKGNAFCLDDPEPEVVILDFGDSAINLRFSIWVKKADFLDAKHKIQCELKERFEREKIEIPFPHVTLTTANAISVQNV